MQHPDFDVGVRVLCLSDISQACRKYIFFRCSLADDGHLDNNTFFRGHVLLLIRFRGSVVDDERFYVRHCG